MSINEATLEARIDSVLRTVFPTFKDVKVEHQLSFSIKFGHHNVTVDQHEPSEYPQRAIADVLLRIGEMNVILLELKKEDLPLTQQDIDQGISYARLIHPMPPLTLISNGKENWFFNTYKKEKIDIQSIDLGLIQQLVDSGFTLAINDFKNAVEILLNNDSSLFTKIITQESEVRFKAMTGEIKDFSKPICAAFSVKRTIIQQIKEEFETPSSLVGIVAPAFSGKTNLLYQFFQETKSENDFVLYINCNDYNYPVMQWLANRFTENLNFPVTKEKIREWLLISMTAGQNMNFYLLLDNFNDSITEVVKNEIIELIDIFNGRNKRILYTTDEFNYERLAYIRNRKYKTIIGARSRVLKLEELNDNEYGEACTTLYQQFRVGIAHGGHFAAEYRQVRILRYLASIYTDEEKSDHYSKIIAVPDVDHVYALADNKIYTSEVHRLYEKIVFCFLKEHLVRKKDGHLTIMASGTGAILAESFREQFASDYEDLINSSFTVLRRLPDHREVIYPKIPELIATKAVGNITTAILDAGKEGKSTSQICATFLDLISPLPYPDIAGTSVLIKISKSNVELFSEIVQLLLEKPPVFEKVKKGTSSLLYEESVGHIIVNFADDMDEGGFVTDFLPYVILSQLSGYPVQLVEDANSEYHPLAFQLTMMYRLASNEHFLLRPEVRSLKTMRPVEHFEWAGIGQIISGHEGIIEPIVQSIQKCFRSIPDDINHLYERGFQENNFAILWRTYLAARELLGSIEEHINEHAANYVRRFNEYFRTFIAEFLSKDIDDPEKREQVKETLLKFKADEPDTI